MNRARVQELRNVIAGIPARKLNLSEIFKGDMAGNSIANQTAPKPCGAVACMAGWALIYPPFVKAGIRSEIGTADPNRFGAPRDAVHSAARFFGFEHGLDTLFYPRMTGERGSHKQIALRRLDALLR